jgi:hypothetical protein
MIWYFWCNRFNRFLSALLSLNPFGKVYPWLLCYNNIISPAMEVYTNNEVFVLFSKEVLSATLV